MGDQPDFAALARQYLDLWEDQLTAMAADPDLAEQSARFFEAMTQLGQDVNPIMTKNLAEFLQSAQTGNTHAPDRPGTATAGTEAPATASGDGDERLDQLARRLALVEERLGRLEAGSGKKPRKPASRTGKKPARRQPRSD